MLASHSMLAVPPEAWFLGKIVCSTDASVPLDAKELERIKGLIVGDGTWADWNVDESMLEDAFRGMEGAKLATVIDALFRTWDKARSENVRWGEKTPRHSYIAGKLQAIFEGAQFIHMLRDGRDSCASMLQRGWYEGSFRRICEHWASCTRAAVEFGKSHPASFHELRFERLLADSAAEMRAVCTFLEVPFEENMVDYQSYAHRHLPISARDLHSKLLKPPDLRESGKWKLTLSLWQEAVFLAVAGRTAEESGYSDGHRYFARLLAPVAALAVGLAHGIDQARIQSSSLRLRRWCR